MIWWIILYFAIGAMFFIHEWIEYENYAKSAAGEAQRREIAPHLNPEVIAQAYLSNYGMMCVFWPIMLLTTGYYFLKFKMFGGIK